MHCIILGLHWIESSICLLNCIGLRSRMKNGQMDIEWIAIELDWIALDVRRGIAGGIRSRAKIRTSQMSTMAGKQFFSLHQR